jgi:hypothetical protein
MAIILPHGVLLTALREASVMPFEQARHEPLKR